MTIIEELMEYGRQIEPNIKLNFRAVWDTVEGFKNEPDAYLFLKKCDDLNIPTDGMYRYGNGKVGVRLRFINH